MFETEEVTTKRETIKGIDIIRCVGLAPNFSNVSLNNDDYSKRYSSGLNWANYALDDEELKQNTLDYITSENKHFDKLLNVKPNRFLHVGKVCYLANNGCPLTQHTKDRLNLQLSSLSSLVEENIEEPEVKVTKTELKLKASKAKVSDLIASIDEIIDDLIINNKQPMIYDFLNKSGIETIIVKEAEQYYKNKYKELLDEISGVDSFDDLDEEERNSYKNDLGMQLVALDNVFPELSCYLGNNKAKKNVSKSKSKKVINEVQKVNKTVKFKTHDSDYKVQSIPLDRVIGAQLLLVFNSKTRKLALYYAMNDKGLQIKGTTLENFDETKSIQKMLRKPETVLSHLQQNNDHRAKIVVRDLSTHEETPNGRLSQYTILLKAFKVLTKV